MLVPAEFLGPDGIDARFSRLLIDAERLSDGQLASLDDGFQRYFARCADLFRRAPGPWFAPRQINLLIAAEQRGVLPYLEPFVGTSALLYASDLDAGPEYVAYLLLHIERLALMKSVRAAVICNLSYWFDRSNDERRAFCEAAARAERPDAAAFVALGKALRWVDELLHDVLRPPKRSPEEPYIGVNDTGMYIPKRLQSKLTNLADAFDRGARDALQSHAATITRPANGALDALCDWLVTERAHVIVVAPDGSIAWSPESNEVDEIRSALDGAHEDAVASVHGDLRVIHTRSRQFLDCVRDVDALPLQCAVLETGGGTYIDAARRTVVYELLQPAFDARTWVAPPYHRLLLGARVMHEWGHVAHTAKMIRVPPDMKASYSQARESLGNCFADVLARIPQRFRSDIQYETRELVATTGDLPKALARKTLARVGDYLSNLLCSRLIPAEEMQSYVRTNVRHHFDEGLGVVSELARYAYEIQYLGLAGLSRDYFFRTSRFQDYFLASGVISEADAHALFDAVASVLAHYDFDEKQLTVPAQARG